MRCCWCQVTSVQMNRYCELNYSDFRVVAYSEENMAADAIARKGFKMADYRTCTVYFTRMDLQSSIRLLTSQYPQFVILLCFLYVGCPDHARAWGSHRAPLASCAGRRTGCTLLWWPSPPTTSATTPPPATIVRIFPVTQLHGGYEGGGRLPEHLPRVLVPGRGGPDLVMC